MYKGRRNVSKLKDFEAAARALAIERYITEVEGELPEGIDDLSRQASSLGHSALSRRGNARKPRLEAMSVRAMDLADLQSTGELALSQVGVPESRVIIQ